MDDVSIDDVVATRELYLTDGGGPVIVTIGRPCPFDDGVSVRCAFQISGLGDAKVQYAVGVDDVQALALAFETIVARLRSSEASRSGRLSFLGADDPNFGFPVSQKLSEIFD